GLVRKQTDVLGVVTLSGYDAAGRLVKTVQAASQPNYDNSYSTGDPSLSRYVPSAAPGLDQITLSGYDPAGHLVTSTDPLGTVTLHAYDSSNRLIKTVRSASQPAYNLAADPTLRHYTPSGQAGQDLVTGTTYDTLSRVAASLDTLGNTTLYGYDGLGRT